MGSNSIAISSKNENEIWKPCLGLEDILEVSNFARVKTKNRRVNVFRKGSHHTQILKGKLLSPCVTKTGYLEVAVVIDGIRKKFRVHRLVGFAFVEGYQDGLTINHIDGNKLNNNPSNLEWVTLARNTEHQWETGLVNLRGDNHPSRKLSSGKVRIIRDLIRKGISCNTLAVLVDVNPTLIYLIRDNKRWSELLC